MHHLQGTLPEPPYTVLASVRGCPLQACTIPVMYCPGIHVQLLSLVLMSNYVTACWACIHKPCKQVLYQCSQVVTQDNTVLTTSAPMDQSVGDHALLATGCSPSKWSYSSSPHLKYASHDNMAGASSAHFLLSGSGVVCVHSKAVCWGGCGYQLLSPCSRQTTSGKALKDFKTTKAPKDVSAALRLYISENPTVKVGASWGGRHIIPVTSFGRARLCLCDSRVAMPVAPHRSQCYRD